MISGVCRMKSFLQNMGGIFLPGYSAFGQLQGGDRMESSDLPGRYQDIQRHIADILKGTGYARKGNYFALLESNNCAYFHFQKSRENNARMLRFTINYGILYGDIAGYGPLELEGKLTRLNPHVCGRLGDFLPGHPDRWWDLREWVESAVIVAEIKGILEEHALSYLKRFMDNDAAIEYWESGGCNGQTQVARDEYLARMKAVREKRRGQRSD